jgi:hypothetical protein
MWLRCSVIVAGNAVRHASPSLAKPANEINVHRFVGCEGSRLEDANNKCTDREEKKRRELLHLYWVIEKN